MYRKLSKIKATTPIENRMASNNLIGEKNHILKSTKKAISTTNLF